MRIALVNNFFPPRASGSSHMTEALAAGLAARGHEVLVVSASFGEAARDEIRDGYRVVRLNSWSLPKSKLTFRFDINFVSSPSNLRALFRILDEFRPDLIHQHGQFFDLTFMSSVYARRRKVPTVLSVHTRLEHPSRLHGFVLWAGDLTLVRSFIEVSRPHVVIMDEPMHRYVRRRYRVPEHRLVPIPVGVEPLRFENVDGAAVRAQLGVGDRPVLLSLGHVIPLRDRLALVEALPLVLEKVPELAVVVVGDVYDDRFLQRARELGVDGSLIITGGVAKDAVPGFLAAADVEAHDLQGYGLGTASLEVMAAGVPVVAALRPDNFPGINLRSGQDLLIVPLGDERALADAIVQLLDDRELAARLAEGQRRLILEHFTTDVLTERHTELYRRVARARAR
jgi:glycosyltransferase involved in cell wall biosynthesis